MIDTRWLTACLCLALAACGDRPDAPAFADESDIPALDAIEADRLRHHVEILAADGMQGRMTGTSHYADAAAYVAEQFDAIGLEPAGDDGWYQEVPLLARRIDVDSAAVTLHRDRGEASLKWREDFVMGGDVRRETTEVRSEVVYVGFGIHAPEMGYSDFDGIDIEGKIIAVFGGAPASFPHNERAYYSSGRTKAEELVRRGAVGWIGLQSRESQQRVPWKRVSMNAGRRPGMAWVNLSGEAADYHPELLGAATLSPAAAARLFAGTPLSFEEAMDAAEAGVPRSTPLGVEVSLERRTRHERTTSPNVIGVLPGSDPRLADEFVVYTAHLDHVGTGAAVDGDDIYNGAYDNAMGVALMIEAARAFAELPKAPRRSILFIALTGEERGLLGSDYFAHYPTVPGDRMVANVNLDMPLFIYPPTDVVAFGAEHSTLGSTIDAAILPEGFTLTPDPMPEEVIFVRSDQYSFVRQGIPSVYLMPGFTSADPEIDGASAFRDHLASHYHQPSDDLSRPVDWDSARRFARANVRIGLAISGADERPSWLPGDFFGERFGRDGRAPAD